jgi:hypothetical protein
MNPLQKYSGHLIMIKADTRDLVDRTDWYECQVIHPNKLLVKMPKWPRDLDKDLDNLKDDLPENKEWILDVLRRAKRAREELQKANRSLNLSYKHLLLEFDEGVELSSSAIFIFGQNGKCEVDTIPIDSYPYAEHADHKQREMATVHTSDWVVFTVARLDLGVALDDEEDQHKVSFSASKHKKREPKKPDSTRSTNMDL